MQRNDGRLFEDRIYDLLALTGVQALTREKQFPSKKVDIYFEVQTFGSRRRYAAECKDVKGVLSQKDIADIRSSYEALLDKRTLTDLLIVSNNRLAPSAQSYVDSHSQLSFQTEGDLRNSIIDFRPYLVGLRARFQAEDVRHYYLPPQGKLLDPQGQDVLVTGKGDWTDLEELILDRLDREDGPLVVLGAYGIGKSTLARALFLKLHDRWQREPAQAYPYTFPLTSCSGSNRSRAYSALYSRRFRPALVTISICSKR